MMRHALVIITLNLGIFFENAAPQNLANEIKKARFCATFDTCDACVQSEHGCVWCYGKSFEGSRCAPKATLLKNGCDERSIFENKENSVIASVDLDKKFQDVTNPDNLEEAVQIKPQKISIKLKPKQPVSFQLKYRPAKNYPLDMYYLMDLTVTMEHDVTAMAALGKELTALLETLTQHFKVAFGYYSDKVAMPFSKMTKELLENPCSDSGKECEKGFDFVHSLNFTNNVDEFIEKINSSKTTSNLDNLEGGMDAIYQIILCEEYVKWRKNSRKIIVIATDGILHFAGDGILAGAVKRNALECFLDENGVYSRSLTYDYPSLEEVYRRLVSHKMNMLFAAKEDALSYYENLHEAIPTVSFVGKLAEKSTNVLDLVRTGYYNVAKKVHFSATNNENVKVTFETDCNIRNASHLVDRCTNVEVGEEYVFNVTLEVGNIPKDIQKETIIIEEETINEKLIIEVEYLGKCKCPENHQDKGCSAHGEFRCGICECQEGWKGDDCHLDCAQQRFEECREKNDSYTSSTCHGRGDCDCGQCTCDEDYTGKYCEKKQCLKNIYGQICSGTTQGICDDGNCKCKKGFVGEDCSCPLSTKSCRPPIVEDVCSNNGQCTCGKCQCQPGYSGSYCENCPTCTGLCEVYEDCVLQTVGTNVTSEKCLSDADGNKEPFIIRMVNSLISDSSTCYVSYEKKDEIICNAQYNYKINPDYNVELEIYEQCGKPVKATLIIGIIIASILGMGIILILAWKSKLKYDEKREYARFQENVQRSKMLEENPLYNSPHRTYEVPMELRELR